VLTIRDGAVVWNREGLNAPDWIKAGPYSNFKYGGPLQNCCRAATVMEQGIVTRSHDHYIRARRKAKPDPDNSNPPKTRFSQFAAVAGMAGVAGV